MNQDVKQGKYIRRYDQVQTSDTERRDMQMKSNHSERKDDHWEKRSHDA